MEWTRASDALFTKTSPELVRIAGSSTQNQGVVFPSLNKKNLRHFGLSAPKFSVSWAVDFLLRVCFAQEDLPQNPGDVNADVAPNELQNGLKAAQVVLQELGGAEGFQAGEVVVL
jgi:hypothetical protein